MQSPGAIAVPAKIAWTVGNRGCASDREGRAPGHITDAWSVRRPRMIRVIVRAIVAHRGTSAAPAARPRHHRPVLISENYAGSAARSGGTKIARASIENSRSRL